MRRTNASLANWNHGSAALVCLILLGCTRSQTAVPASSLVEQRVEIEAAPAERSRISSTLETVGTLLPIRATTIVAEIDGIIERLPESQYTFEFQENGQQQAVPLGLDIGSMVQAGDVLVQLDPRDAELDLAQAEARLRLAESRQEELQSWKRREEVQQAQATVDECQAAWQLATAELERIQRLRDTNATSKAQLDMAEAAEKRAKAALDQASAALDLAKEGPTKEQLAVAKAEVDAANVEVLQRRRDLEKTVIRSPYAAVVTDRLVDIGDRVTAMPRVEIMKIVDPRVLFAEIDVPERFAGLVHQHQPADVYAEADARPIPGKIELINGLVDPETRTFRTRIGIDNRDGRLMPGGLARVVVEIASQPDALVVPRHAVSFNNGNPAVFVYEADGRVTHRSVKLGITNPDACQIVAGLEEGELIAVTNLALLADGMPVRLKAKTAQSVELSRVSAREVQP